MSHGNAGEPWTKEEDALVLAIIAESRERWILRACEALPWRTRAAIQVHVSLLENRPAPKPPPPPRQPDEQRSSAIIAYRLWEVRPAGKLAFLESVQTRTLWPIGEPLVAHTLAFDKEHVGIHAFKTRRTEPQYRVDYSVPEKVKLICFGTVSLWGRVIEHEHGWRAQYAYPYVICVPRSVPNHEHVAQALRRAYGCEVAAEPTPKERAKLAGAS